MLINLNLMETDKYRLPLLRKKKENVYVYILVIHSKTAVVNNNGPPLVM